MTPTTNPLTTYIVATQQIVHRRIHVRAETERDARAIAAHYCRRLRPNQFTVDGERSLACFHTHSVVDCWPAQDQEPAQS